MGRAKQLRESMTEELNASDSPFKLWWGRLEAPDPYDEADLYAKLSPPEQARAQRLRVAEKRKEFILSRLHIRAFVKECAFLPDHTEIGFDAAGKPELQGAYGAHISWSRSGPWLAIAISAAAPVGIDVERVRDLNMPPMVDMICAPQEAALMQAIPDDQKRESFFRLWTLKEAILKCIGTGFQSRAKDINLPASVLQQDPQMPRRCEAFGRAFLLSHWAEGNARIALATEC